MKNKRPLLTFLGLLLFCLTHAQADEKKDPIQVRSIAFNSNEPLTIEDFISTIENNENGGILEKINVFIEPEAQGTLIAPVNVRNVSVWTLLNTVAPHAGLEIDYSGRGSSELAGIIHIKKKPRKNERYSASVSTKTSNRDLISGTTSDDDLVPSKKKLPTDHDDFDFSNKSQLQPFESIPLKTDSPQLSVISLGKLNPTRWIMHADSLTHLLKTHAQIEVKAPQFKFEKSGQLLILKQSPEKLKQVELLVHAYLASMVEIEGKADALIAPLEEEIRTMYFNLSTYDDEPDHPKAQTIKKEVKRLRDRIADIKEEFDLL